MACAGPMRRSTRSATPAAAHASRAMLVHSSLTSQHTRRPPAGSPFAMASAGRAGERADLDGRPRADGSGEQGEQHDLVGSGLHAGDGAQVSGGLDELGLDRIERRRVGDHVVVQRVVEGEGSAHPRDATGGPEGHSSTTPPVEIPVDKRGPVGDCREILGKTLGICTKGLTARFRGLQSAFCRETPSGTGRGRPARGDRTDAPTGRAIVHDGATETDHGWPRNGRNDLEVERHQMRTDLRDRAQVANRGPRKRPSPQGDGASARARWDGPEESTGFGREATGASGVFGRSERDPGVRDAGRQVRERPVRLRLDRGPVAP